jgi:hypothetical protein
MYYIITSTQLYPKSIILLPRPGGILSASGRAKLPPWLTACGQKAPLYIYPRGLEFPPLNLSPDSILEIHSI